MKYTTIASGVLNQDIATSLKQQFPLFGSLYGSLKNGMVKYSELYPQKQAKTISSIALNTSEMDQIVEYATRKITLDQVKKEEILTVAEKPSKNYEKFYLEWKDAAVVNSYDTHEKKLALKDASMLIMACCLGLIDRDKKPEEIQDDFVKIIIQGKFEDELLANVSTLLEVPVVVPVVDTKRSSCCVIF